MFVTKLNDVKNVTPIRTSLFARYVPTKKRDRKVVCVVEDVRDVMAIENTRLFKGLYHVLGGKISPIEGVGPSQLTIDKLVKRIKEEEISEIILALSATMEGDTTGLLYIQTIVRYRSENLKYCSWDCSGRRNRICRRSDIRSKYCESSLF